MRIKIIRCDQIMKFHLKGGWKQFLQLKKHSKTAKIMNIKIKIIRVSQFSLINYHDITGERAKAANTEGDKKSWPNGNFN